MQMSGLELLIYFAKKQICLFHYISQIETNELYSEFILSYVYFL